MRRISPVVSVLAVLAIFTVFTLCESDLRADVRIETMDMRIFEGKLVSMEGGNVSVTIAGKTRKFQVDEIANLFLRPATSVEKSRGRAVIMTSLGERIIADDITISGGGMKMRCDFAGEIRRPLSVVNAVYLPLPSQTLQAVRDRCGLLGAAAASGDVVVVAKSAKDWVIVDGVIKKMDSDAIVFEWKGKDRRISRDKVRAILPATAAGASANISNIPDVPGVCGMLVSSCGTEIAFKSITCTDGVFRVLVRNPVAGEKVSVPSEKVSSVRFVSPDVVDLVDLRPAKIVEHGFFDRTLAYRIGSNVLGGPLKIKGRTYMRGLGLHSYCELTYKLDGKYAILACLAGIDASSGPCGDAVLEFVGDGKPLCKPVRLIGAEEARRVAVELDGVKVLVIRVGFGKDKVDIGDRVNIVSARLRRNLAR